MGKIKLNLTSGGVVEKPLITAFKGTNGNYVVLDNEMNGGMGLPIILVCKLENDRLVKINDQTEWGMVKENLKSIIAGGNIEYLKINNELPADDVYFTQLTLPVPSFDTLKNTYKVDEDNSTSSLETASIFDVNPEVNNINTPVMDTNKTVENGTPIDNVITPMSEENNNTSPVINPFENIGMPSNTSNPVNMTSNIDISIPNVSDSVASAPVVDIEKEITSVIEPAGNENNNVSPVSPVINEEAKIDVPKAEAVNMNTGVGEMPSMAVPSFGIADDLFKEQKEAFMQACENMFDALVQKFEKELEKNKGN